jgi:hypothetical protein
VPFPSLTPSAGSARLSSAPSKRRNALPAIHLAILLSLLPLGAPDAAACDWWRCPESTYASRPTARTHPARSYPYARRSDRPAWSYGYTSPARARGYAYAPWPSTSMPSSGWYTETAMPVPNANAVGLTAPIATAEGLLEAGLPPSGPSLFGPDPPPPTWGYYYGSPAYGYTAARRYRSPPADTPSWWVEPRRRR